MQGLVEPLPGVHVVDTYAHCAILTDQRLVLVDTSSEANARSVLAALAQLKVKPADLTSVFITHTHPDHVSGLAAVRKQYPARVAAHEIEAPFIAKETIYDGPPGPATQRHEAVRVDVRLRDGQVHDGLRVVHTPGHTRGHISLLDEERRLLVAGDALNTDPGSGPIPKGLAVGLMNDAFNVDPHQHRASAKKLAGLDFDALVPGHGDPIPKGAGEAVRALARTL